ncbi:hypothetical protein MalM25_34060 [Planctomycetes bacterium MalM25]|nr:hypothetical protein MalM25_34060 [Planctomycetes bacterium MalM25]
MIRTLSVALISLAAASHASAALLSVPGIPSFNTSLGTLTKATVTIDPLPTVTSIHSANFDNIGNHTHTAFPSAVAVPGLGAFPFVPVQTSFGDSNPFSDHDHTVDLLPSVKMFTGPDLAWFLDPANGVNFVTFVTSSTSENENHTHTFRPTPTQPMTTFEFTPVPEPGAALLALLGFAAGVCRR